MEWVKFILLVLMVMTGILMTFLIMLQEGKGGGLAALGGTKAAGVEGVTNPIRRATGYLAGLFFILAIILGIVNKPEQSLMTKQAEEAARIEQEKKEKEAAEEKAKADQEKAEADKAKADVEKAKADAAKTTKPGDAEKPTGDAKPADQKAVEPAKVEGVATPADAPKADAPKADAPKADAPKAGDAAKEAPKP